MALMHLVDQWEPNGRSRPAGLLCEQWRQPNGWREVLAVAARRAWESMDGAGWRRRLPKLSAPLQGVTSSEATPLAEKTLNLVQEALEFGVLLGFSLARTGPAGVEDQDRWLQLALVYMVETSEPES